ncbi:hypothetical protein GGX14DRAFT_405857 [Mycena pura]|uniref:Uncharacterized protein n=1 Tax=Mycena pura TaxID=153505 RepID=A0AAD6UYJ5_9AGAR|nr:hypothetical protein GGX14DRAFT_405857 [Mycena pura]
MPSWPSSYLIVQNAVTRETVLPGVLGISMWDVRRSGHERHMQDSEFLLKLRVSRDEQRSLKNPEDKIAEWLPLQALAPVPLQLLSLNSPPRRSCNISSPCVENPPSHDKENANPREKGTSPKKRWCLF